MSATWITLSRFPLLLASVVALYQDSPAVRLVGVGLLLVGLLLDTVDGIVARRTRQASLVGGVLDIAADRTYELVLWVGFGDLGLIPAWIAFVILARTTLTDAFRSLGVAQGTAPLDQHRSGVGRFLVRSAVARVGYSIGKVTTFCGLGLIWALSGASAGSFPARVAAAMHLAVGVALPATVLLCLLRGVPVIAEGLTRALTAGRPRTPAWWRTGPPAPWPAPASWPAPPRAGPTDSRR
jgi:phosphatidylglycerophosphate synthase